MFCMDLRKSAYGSMENTTTAVLSPLSSPGLASLMTSSVTDSEEDDVSAFGCVSSTSDVDVPGDDDGKHGWLLASSSSWM